MKINRNVPATETGAVKGDYRGSRNFNRLAEKGGHNKTMNEARHSKSGGPAPKPQGGANLLGHSKPSAPTQAAMARVKSAGSHKGAASFGSPLSGNNYANQSSVRIGQKDPSSFTPSGPGVNVAPKTKTAVTNAPHATVKPKRKGLGAAFYDEY